MKQKNGSSTAVVLGAALVLGVLACGAGRAPALARQAPPEVAEARRLIAEKKFEEAETILTGFVSKNPKAPGAWASLGFARQSQKKWPAALEAYEKAAEFPQVRPTAFYNMACIYAQTNESEKAIAKLKEAIEAGFDDRELLKTDPDLDTLRKDKRYAGLMPPILTGQDLFVEPVQILHAYDGEGRNEQFGWVLARVGDLDGDKVQDFATTALTFGGSKGKVYVYSGRSGALLFSREGKAGSVYGNGVAGVGDVDGDGIPDVGACGQGGKGIAEVLSGKDGHVLLSLEGEQTADLFGSKIAGIGDVNGDGRADIVVTATKGPGRAPQSGAAYGFSGKDGARLFKVDGEEAGDQFGCSVEGRADRAHPMLVVGAQDAGPNDKGRVYAYGLETGKPVLKFTVESDPQSTDLGQMFLSFPGDYDRDGIPDIFCSDFNYVVDGQATGRILVVSSASGKVLLERKGIVPGEGLGTSRSDAGDVDRDGIGDLIVGAWQNGAAARSGGRTYLFSGKTGRVLAQWTCRQAGDTFGFDAIGIGDVNGDGKIDFAVTSAWSNVKGTKTGRVFVIAGRDYGKP